MARPVQGTALVLATDTEHEEEHPMAAHAGEKAQKTGDFYCAHCDEKVHVTQGDEIPPCPNGHKTFDARRNEPGNKS